MSNTASSAIEAEFRRSWSAVALPCAFGAVVTVLLVAGYRLRHLDLITADYGAGYFFGIAGGILMLLLLLYPLRKRVSNAAFLGSPRLWFRLHMLFGVLGPLLVLFHANFRLGSTNSNVALFSMLIVAGSGFFGRYFYAKIHHGLYGRKASLEELTGTLASSTDVLSQRQAISPEIRSQLLAFSNRTLGSSSGLLIGLACSLRGSLDGFLTRCRVRRILRAELSETPTDKAQKNRLYREVDTLSRLFIARTKAVSEFVVYERLFALWHVLHLPLFFMLVIAACVHVVAVHLY